MIGGHIFIPWKTLFQVGDGLVDWCLMCHGLQLTQRRSFCRQITACGGSLVQISEAHTSGVWGVKYLRHIPLECKMRGGALLFISWETHISVFLIEGWPTALHVSMASSQFQHFQLGVPKACAYRESPTSEKRAPGILSILYLLSVSLMCPARVPAVLRQPPKAHLWDSDACTLCI